MPGGGDHSDHSYRGRVRSGRHDGGRRSGLGPGRGRCGSGLGQAWVRDSRDKIKANKRIGNAVHHPGAAVNRIT